MPDQAPLTPLAGYRRLAPAPAVGWREANDTVQRIGGWRAYARESAADAAPAAATAPGPGPLMPSSQDGSPPGPTSGQRGSPAQQALQQALQPHLGPPLADLAWAQAPGQHAQRVAALLAQPLQQDDAVRITLLQHPGLRARLAELAITEAEVDQALRLPNPGISLGISRHGDERTLERGLHLNLARLLLRPWLRAAESPRLAQAQQQAVLQVLTHVADTRRAWVQAVAAQEGLRYARQVLQAAEASAELAKRMAAVGNFSKLQRAREQAFYADAALGLLRAEQTALATREQLARRLGLWGTQTQFTLPERLPDLPAQPHHQPQAEAQALAQRLDVQAARQAVAHAAAQAGVDRTEPWLMALGLELEDARSPGSPRERTVAFTLELPLFDNGQARRNRAQAQLDAARARLDDSAITARSELRQAQGQLQLAWAAARHHRDELLPLQQQIAEENLLRYNGMLIGVFELLADARNQIHGVNAAIQAQAAYWLAHIDHGLAQVAPAGLGGAEASAPVAASSSAGAGAAGGH